MKIPQLFSYSTSPSASGVSIGNLDIYFSYTTPIAFKYNGALTIRQNGWSTTTGTHLNQINRDHSIRIPGGEFEQRLADIVGTI